MSRWDVKDVWHLRRRVSLELTERGQSKKSTGATLPSVSQGVTDQNCASKHSKNRPQGSQHGA